MRDEVAYGLQEVERKSLDLAKQIEGAVTSAVDGERAARQAHELSLRRQWRAAPSQSGKLQRTRSRLH